MDTNLDNTLKDILNNDTKEIITQEETAAPAEQNSDEQEINEQEGVNNTAESQQEESKQEEEGNSPSNSDLEEELKNIDPELKEAILNAPPELRENQIKVFKKMRASIDRKHTELGETKKLAEATKDLFKQYGISEKDGLDQVKNLIAFEKKLKENPKEVIKNLQKLFKLDEEEKLGSEENNGIDLDSLTDNEKILFNKIEEAKKEAKLVKQELEKTKKLSENEQQLAILKEIEDFKSAIDELGNLKNPFFEELLPEMEKLSVSYPNDNIEKLYKKALKLNDDVFQKYQDKEREKQNIFLTKKQEEALLKAKSINSQTLKHKSSSSQKIKSLDEQLLDILNSQA